MIKEQFQQRVTQNINTAEERRQALGSEFRAAPEMVTLQLQEEEATYQHLAETDSETLMVTPYEHSRNLAPRIEEAGTSKKRRGMLRSRTLKNLEAGRAEVGQMATTQTVPLMKSMRRNARALERKRNEKVEDITTLANLQIPADIFDVSLTKEHSHFDVKRALMIKDQLAKIAEFKEQNPDDYAFLDFETYSRFEALLDMKEPFETTLKTVLAANGLTETGDRLTEGEIRKAREKYYAVKDAYRETFEDQDALLQAKQTEIRDKLSANLKYGGTFLRSRTEMRDSLLDDWASLAANDTESLQIPEGFVGSVFYSRGVMRMNPENREESYQALKTAMRAYLLSSHRVSAEDEPQVFGAMVKEITPLVNAYREKLPKLIGRIQGAGIDELVDIMQEIQAIEYPVMHFNDVTREIKNSQGQSVRDVLGLSKTELAGMSECTNYLSTYRKKLVLVNAIKAANAGIPIKFDELDLNLKTALHGLADANGIVPAEAAVPVLKDKLRATHAGIAAVLNGEIPKKLNLIEEERTKVTSFAEKESVMEAEGTQLSGTLAAYMAQQFGNNTMAYFDTFIARDVKTRDLSHMYELYKRSGLVYTKLGPEASVKDAQEAGFKRLIRELFGGYGGGLDFSKETLTGKIDEGEITFEEVTALLEHPDDEHIMDFLRPLLEFDYEEFLGRFTADVFQNPAAIFEKVGQALADAHKALGLKQWAEVFVKEGVVSPESMKKLNAAFMKFATISNVVGAFALPTGYSPTEFLSLDMPRLKEVLTTTDHADELLAGYTQAEHAFTDAHASVTYTAQELTSWNLGGLNKEGFLAGTRSEGGGRSMPVSREEMQKITSADKEFLTGLAESVSQFSFVCDKGRARVISSSASGDLAFFGAEDMIYYSEMAHKAKMLEMSSTSNSSGFARTFGSKTNETLKACRQIIAVCEDLKSKLNNPSYMPSQMRFDYNKHGAGETYEQMELRRLDQLTEATHLRQRQFAAGNK